MARHSQRGFSMIEMMVSLVIASVIAMIAYTVLTATERSSRANHRIIQAQQNVRTAMDLLTSDLKSAGFGLRAPVGACGISVGGSTIAAPLVPGDQNPVGNDTGPDKISLVIPTSGNASTWILAADTPIGFTELTLPAGTIAALTLAGLVPDDPLFDQISIGGVTTVHVKSVGGTILTLSSPVPAPARFVAGTPIYLLQCVTYQIIQAPDPNALCAGNAPCLVRGITPLTHALNCNVPNSPCYSIADGIEDLQLAYGCDGCNPVVNSGIPDRIIDDHGAIDNTITDADFISNSLWNQPPMTPGTIRLVKVGLLARQVIRDQGFGESMTPTLSSQNTVNISLNNDHPITFTLSDKQYRRRTILRTVDLRNAGLTQ